MTYYLIKRTIFLAILLSSLLSTTSIKGNIVNSENNEVLIGANVYIEETSQGDATDINGSFIIENIETCNNCSYTLKVLYIGFEEYSVKIDAFNNQEIILNLEMTPASLEAETTTVTAKKRQDKVTDAPAAIELVSAKDIKKEESTNLGSYLKGIKGVDFTSSGINNYSISVRGFNSSFTSRLLTLTDGRIANIPALRVVNYSTVPQSSKDIENIEVILGPSSALYGANAHSGVVNIISKSPATSEGLDVSISGSLNDERNLYRFSSRWANKINDKLSFKLSTTYLQAYEWEFIAENEYLAHKYPWSGHPERMSDKKDNNPYSFSASWEGDGAILDTAYRNYLDVDNDGVFNPNIDNAYIEMVSDDNWCRTGDVNGVNYECEMVTKYVGNGEANDTGDPDGDGFMGEDWFNGYDDDGDCPGDTNGDGMTCGPGDEGVDEDYFFADGIDNDGDCPGDTNGDGVICGPGDDGVDEQIDYSDDQWIDGVDNNGNGLIDETAERYGNDEDKFFLPDWQYDLEYGDIIISNGREKEWIINQYGDTIRYNSWYSEIDNHLRGEYYYDEDKVKLFFDVYIYDFGEDGIPGDNAWIDVFGDNSFTPNEGANLIFFSDEWVPVPSEGCLEVLATANGSCGDWDDGDTFNVRDHDLGLDGIPNTGDYGEGDGVWTSFDWNNDGQYTDGDDWNYSILDNCNPFETNGCFNDLEEDVDWWDDWPPPNGQYDIGEQILDWGQDGIENTNDYGEGDDILAFLDEGELDGDFDFGDGCFGCDAEPYVDNNNNGRYDCNSPSDPTNCDSFDDLNGDGQWTPQDYKDNLRDSNDINGDGILDYPDFEVKNSKTEFRLDFDPQPDLNITFQSGYSWSKLGQVTGTGRYLADGYRYTFYQLRARYKNWFSQIYLNQGNSGETRGYDLGNVITDQSKNMAFQLQNNFKINNTKFVWGMDFFRTEASTNGSILNDGPNGYDNDGDSWFTSKDDIDNDMDSNDFSDFGIDGIGPHAINNDGDLVIDNCDSCEQVVNSNASGASYNPILDFWYIDSNGDGVWTNNLNGPENLCYPFVCNENWTEADFGEGNGIPDPGEPGVNDDGFVIVDGIDNDCDGCDFDGDGYPNFQEIQLGTNIYDVTDFPIGIIAFDSSTDLGDAIDEMIDENYCGNIEYETYVPGYQFSGYRDGREWKCGEGIDERNEFINVTSNEMGLYFQTKTIPGNNQKWEIITAARFDHHDQIDEAIQFAPKFGIFYKPSTLQTFRLTYGKAYNTPSALNLHTDLFIGKRGIVDYYLRGNKDGTPYYRVGDEYISSIPQIEINNEYYSMVNITGSGNVSYWDEYADRIQGAPYFLGFRTEFSDVPDFMPLDTLLYTVWVPELTDTGRIYTPLEALTIPDVDPIKTEKIQTFELGFKGFISKRIHLTADLYASFYEDFFSSPTVVTPLIIRRNFDENGNDITSVENGIDVVGMLPINYNMSNPPYATQWDGRDNDGDWQYFGEHLYFDNYTTEVEDGNNYTSYDHPNDCSYESGGCYEPNGGWYHWFDWDGHEESYEDWNDNNMYDYGEPFIDEDGNDAWNCIDCNGEWGYVDWIQEANGDTLGYTIYRAQDVVNTDIAMEYGNIQYAAVYADASEYWDPVGIDEYSGVNGLSETEMIDSPLVNAYGESTPSPGFAYTPLHSILAPMNYGEIWTSGLDIGLTYLIPNQKITLEGNFSFYNTTSYYNVLTKKNDPINAPKFKMNASIGWQSPIGDIALKYRHVDQFEWKDGIWAGIIGPYDLFDLHYNYKINRFMEINLTAINIFNDRHKEMIGGAVMGRQIIMRLSASI